MAHVDGGLDPFQDVVLFVLFISAAATVVFFFFFFFNQNPPLQMGAFDLSQFRACWERLHQYVGGGFMCVVMIACELHVG